MNNPPAFPIIMPERDDALLKSEGMTLRDYFAAAAIMGLIRERGVFADHYDEIAKCGYSVADAMLKAREG